MAKSQKTIVIERIFDTLYNPATGTLSRAVVAAQDIEEAKAYCNANLGTSIKLNANHYTRSSVLRQNCDAMQKIRRRSSYCHVALGSLSGSHP